MTTVHFVRHGATDQLGQVLSGWTPGVDLNAEGRAAVAALAAKLARLPIAALYTSPLERARETAQILAAPNRLEPRLAPEAAEVRYGVVTGKRFDALHDDAGWRRWNTFRSGTRIAHAETMIEVQARVAWLLLRLRDQHRDQQVIVVTHADVIKIALAYVLGTPIDLMQRIEIEPASVSTIAIGDDDVRVLGVNRQG